MQGFTVTYLISAYCKRADKFEMQMGFALLGKRSQWEQVSEIFMQKGRLCTQNRL